MSDKLLGDYFNNDKINVVLYGYTIKRCNLGHTIYSLMINAKILKAKA